MYRTLEMTSASPSLKSIEFLPFPNSLQWPENWLQFFPIWSYDSLVADFQGHPQRSLRLGVCVPMASPPLLNRADLHNQDGGNYGMGLSSPRYEDTLVSLLRSAGYLVWEEASCHAVRTLKQLLWGNPCNEEPGAQAISHGSWSSILQSQQRLQPWPTTQIQGPDRPRASTTQPSHLQIPGS